MTMLRGESEQQGLHQKGNVNPNSKLNVNFLPPSLDSDAIANTIKSFPMGRWGIPEPVKLGIIGDNQTIMIEDIEANNREMHKHETNKVLLVPAITISAPMPQPPKIAMEALKHLTR